jgi:hypothetical protein
MPVYTSLVLSQYDRMRMRQFGIYRITKGVAFQIERERAARITTESSCDSHWMFRHIQPGKTRTESQAARPSVVEEEEEEDTT